VSARGNEREKRVYLQLEHETSSLYSCWKGNQASRSCFLEAASLLKRVSWICGMIIGGTYRAPETMATTLDMMLEESIDMAKDTYR
jgi:hypothetical protein